MSYLDDASLVMIPSGYKDGKLYSVKPSNGAGDFTFTRGSNLAATRVDENGLIEKGRENLLLQSNQFDTTWTQSNASVTSGQTGYDGSSDAWLFESASNACNTIQSISTSGVQTFSVYAKAGTANWFRILGDSSPDYVAFFDLSGSGSVGTTSGEIDTKIEFIGSGWFRCSITGNATISRIIINIADSDGSVTGLSAGDNIYIQDAQLEYGLVATDYIETGATTAQAGILEDMPRLDYSGGTCPALLLEPQRTNLSTNSEYLDGISWIGKIGTSFDTNTTTSPEGLGNASLLKEDSSNGSHFAFKDFNLTSGSIYTISIFAKANGVNRNLRLGDGSLGWGTGFTGQFDLTAGTATGGTIEPMGSGWYRCSVTGTTNATTSRLIVYSTLGTATTYQGDGASGVYLYGLQLEQGSYPTSYIPTYGTSVTRGADSCSKTGVSSLIGQTEGTLYAEVDWNVKPESGSPAVGIVALNNGANNLQNSIFLGIERQVGGTNRVYCFVINSNVTQAEIFGSAITDGIYKIAFAYKANDFALYVNGSQIGTDTSGSVPALNEVFLGKRFGTDTYIQADGTKQAVLFDTRLTNSELAALTTL